jgi:hypothetical protein
LREGIQDYEKISIVKEKLTKLKNDEARALRAELASLLKNFSYQKAQSESISDQVNESKQLLAKISQYLVHQ